MNRFLRFMGIVFICTIILALINEWACRWLISQSTGNPIYKMERLYGNADNNEIAIVGSSRAQAHYVPSLISTNCFNYGCDGQSFGETLFHLSALKKRGGGAPIIVNFDPWWSTISGSDGSFVCDYRLAPQSGRVHGVDAIPGIRFYGCLRKSVTDWLNAKQSVTKVIDNGAVLQKHSRSASEWKVINEKLIPRSFVRDEEACLKFKKVLSGLSPRKVYVVIPPCSTRFMDLFKGLDVLCQYMKELDSIPNVTVVNMLVDKRFSQADFVDTTHLNIEGAYKFTSFLVELIDAK